VGGYLQHYTRCMNWRLKGHWTKKDTSNIRIAKMSFGGPQGGL
jgi:hypothetical protein